MYKNIENIAFARSRNIHKNDILYLHKYANIINVGKRLII